MQSKGKSFLRFLMILLTVLLSVSIVLLAWILLKKESGKTVSVSVPNNILTNDKTVFEKEQNEKTDAELPETDPPLTQNEKEISIALHAFHPNDNAAFLAENMFPGDRLYNEYAVKVCYQDTVTVHFGMDITSQTQNLSQALDCQVSLLPSGEVLYDGKIADMPASLSKVLRSENNTEDTVRYAVAVSLDTSAGNAYQNGSVKADFRWWVEEGEHLLPPQTGDDTYLFLYAAVVFLSAAVLVFLLYLRRKEGNRQ